MDRWVIGLNAGLAVYALIIQWVRFRSNTWCRYKKENAFLIVLLIISILNAVNIIT
ncbi:hypothetical protein J2T17_005632 [Paenibacillus mucilaginosus]|uniref:hypothetical protein n=1 Tax=Paenibacillus mucilaginosus TaxID=61624 RepID=UPI003D20BD40